MTRFFVAFVGVAIIMAAILGFVSLTLWATETYGILGLAPIIVVMAVFAGFMNMYGGDNG